MILAPSEDFVAEFLRLPAAVRDRLIDSMAPTEALQLLSDWRVWGRRKQFAPPGNWQVWFNLGGRGAGKTRVGAEWMHAKAEAMPSSRGFLLGTTASDVRDTMVEGEALALDTPIATPDGWTTVGALRVGDAVFSRDGMPTTVIAVSEVWTNRPCYAVRMDAVASIIADERHQWVTSDRCEREPRRSVRGESVRSTIEIAKRLTTRGRPDLYEHEVLLALPLQLPERELPVPPYTLGAWLGDGDTRGHGTFTCDPKDAETITHIRGEGFDVRRRSDHFGWGIRGIGRLLRAAFLVGAKHVPSVYLRASAGQRLALLQGLMDTDGYCSARGQCSFDNTNAGLVESVRELLVSLGFRPSVIQAKPDKRGYKVMYRIVFERGPCTPVPFRLARKVARCRVALQPRGRLIRDVSLVSSVATCCIQVAHPSGTFLAGREMIVTHNSGILSTQKPHNPVTYNPSRRLVKWKNGAQARIFTGEEPDRLRGPQHHFGWCDEWAAFKYPKEAFDMMMFGLRLGQHPQTCFTTTPKPILALIELLAGAPLCSELRDAEPGSDILSRFIRVVATVASSYENRGNLSEAWYQTTIKAYEGTSLYDQEVLAKILTDVQGALWKMETVEACRITLDPITLQPQALPEFNRVVIAVDPAVTSGKHSNETGIMAVARSLIGGEQHGYLLADYSGRYTPDQWARKVKWAYEHHKADRVVAEQNQGGDLVRTNVHTVDADIPVKLVTATRGKTVRAEPIAAKYEQRKIHHVGTYGPLESQMTTWTPDSGMDSPDRLDAMVWGFTELLLQKQGAFVV